MPRKKSEHYVNNKELLEAMIVYRSKVEKSYKETFNKDLTEQPRQERGKGGRVNHQFQIILEIVF